MNINPSLRKKLIKQRQELFAEAEENYLGWESQALDLTQGSGSPSLVTAAVRATWIEWAGEPPTRWREKIQPLVEADVASLTKGVSNELRTATWINDPLLQRTILVLQRRSLSRISAGKAARALIRIETLAQQGVQP